MIFLGGGRQARQSGETWGAWAKGKSLSDKFNEGNEEFLRANLHGTIFVACDNGLRQANDMIYDCFVRQEKCRSILKHVLKRYDNRKSCLRPVVSLSHATKIAPCKSALRYAHCIFTW